VTSRDPECITVREDLGEFALGLLTGRERARVLNHVTSCAACQVELEALTTVSDQLIALSPFTEAPLGFESRLLSRYHAQSRRPVHRFLRVVAIAAASLVLITAGFILAHHGALRGSATPRADSAAPISATLTSKGRDLGHLWLSTGTTAWIYMSVNDANWTGTAWCSVTLRNGRVLDVGEFAMANGYGAWAARLDASSSDVRSARVTDASGHVIASATLSA
jgi:hypothetical protein